MSTTALGKAINGQKVPDNQAKGALAEAVDKIKNLGGRISKAKEVAEHVSDAVIHTAEIQATVFAGSFAEGYLGEEKMDIGPVDLRAAAGVVVGGYGVYQAMQGKGGAHALALGNGLLATGVARIGRNAGKALAEKKEKKEEAAPAPAPAPAIPAPNGDFGDLVRDIFLTPDETAGKEGRDRSRPSRFIRASVA